MRRFRRGRRHCDGTCVEQGPHRSGRDGRVAPIVPHPGCGKIMRLPSRFEAREDAQDLVSSANGISYGRGRERGGAGRFPVSAIIASRAPAQRSGGRPGAGDEVVGGRPASASWKASRPGLDGWKDIRCRMVIAQHEDRVLSTTAMSARPTAGGRKLAYATSKREPVRNMHEQQHLALHRRLVMGGRSGGEGRAARRDRMSTAAS